jgi:hypothetical protein
MANNSSHPAAPWFRWWTIIAAICVGLFTPLRYQAIAIVALYLGYVGCHRYAWPRYQQFIAYLIGGACFGAGLQLAIGFEAQGSTVIACIALLLTWLVTRALFLFFENRYALIKSVANEKITFSTTTSKHGAGVSAWAGEAQGKTPDGSLTWEFFGGGEIAMGGPTYGEAVFSNRCAFTGVGPSTVVSDNGRYAAMTLPSRNQWGFLLADFVDMTVFELLDTALWEIDRIDDTTVYGRHSPLVSNVATTVTIDLIKQHATRLTLVNDNGWWVIDYPEREPLPTFEVKSVASHKQSHCVRFVPDTGILERNPFARYQASKCSVFVDDVALDVTASNPTAVWVDDANHDGRFLQVEDTLFNFVDDVSGEFDVAKRTSLPLAKFDDSTYISFGAAANNGLSSLQVSAMAMPRSISNTEAECTVYSYTHPWDDEEVRYWNANGAQRQQARTRIQRHYRYTIDLDKYFFVRALHLATRIELLNSVSSANTAVFEHQWRDDGVDYSQYRCTTSCGVDPGPVTHEAIWSHCGRYLAVVVFEPKPAVPHRIRIIDFKTASIRDVPGSFALPNFMWFDEHMLDLTHLVGIEESITFGPGRAEQRTLRLTDANSTESPYDLLIGNLSARREALGEEAKKKRRGSDYANGSVHLVLQHCILFAPNFDQPVLQPPTSAQKSAESN